MFIRPAIGLSIAALATLLSACAASYSPQRATGRQSPDMFGQALMVVQPVTIPGNKSHTKFANGRQVDKIERFTPYCEFEVNSMSRTPREVPPGAYSIGYVGNKMARDEVSGFLSVGLPSIENMFGITTIKLQDPRGEVRSLTCKREFPSSLSVWFPSRDQINAILGPSMRLE